MNGCANISLESLCSTLICAAVQLLHCAVCHLQTLLDVNNCTDHAVALMLHIRSDC